MTNPLDKTRRMTSSQPETINPLLVSWNTPDGVPPFHLIHNEHFIPAFREGILRHQEEIRQIADRTEKASFHNTVEALEFSGALLDKVSRIFHNLHSSHTSEALEEIAGEITPILSEHYDNLMLDTALFGRIREVHRQQHSLNLNTSQSRLLEETYRSYVRNGAELDETGKQQLREINSQLAMLTLRFEQNLLAENNNFQLLISEAAQLSGLPESIRSQASEAATRAGHPGQWLFTLHAPSLFPFLRYADDRSLRQMMLNAYLRRGDNGNERDNNAIVTEMLRLRIIKARLLGYGCYAGYVLEETMAGRPETVMQLLNSIWPAALRRAQEESLLLEQLLQHNMPGATLEPADWRYCAEKLRKQAYDLDEEELRAYFPLEQVVEQGLFGMARAMYGLEFKRMDDYPVYHPEVVAYRVLHPEGGLQGILYLDFFPRPEKHNGAWMSEFRAQSYESGTRVPPVIVLVCNLSKPSGQNPSLLNSEEVSTLFHEFGHALHGLLSDVSYSSLSGTSVPRDFVELPSQFHENIAFEPEVLSLYARHHQTGAPIPAGLTEKLRHSATFNQGFETVEYLAAAFLDMEYHLLQDEAPENIPDFESRLCGRLGLIPQVPPRYRSTQFMHIFSHGYAAGYYSYLWSAVLDADAVEAFRETGCILNKDKAEAFRSHILCKGYTEDARIMYLNFRGREPSMEPLLRRKGMLPQTPPRRLGT